jgi:hypothetical protein
MQDVKFVGLTIFDLYTVMLVGLTIVDKVSWFWIPVPYLFAALLTFIGRAVLKYKLKKFMQSQEAQVK